MSGIEWLLLGIAIGFYGAIWLKRKVWQMRDDNYYRFDVAQHYYGKDWTRAMIECDESHLKGTCVLCGGEDI